MQSRQQDAEGGTGNKRHSLVTVASTAHINKVMSLAG